EEAYALMPPERRGSGDVFDSFDGSVIPARSWKPISVRAVRDGSGGDQPADFSLVWTEPALSRRAAETLRSILLPHAQLLPLTTDIGEYFALNVTTVIDALDEQSSALQRFASGRVMHVRDWVFRPDALGDVPIFKIPQLPRAFVFLNTALLGAIQTAGLSGLDPQLIWQMMRRPAL
ncbi:MAG TPA: DUF1629 domain-containing protein, partial [Gemmatimonadales bacterium]|nr:DUF1629 domain-containing protein [Gemmatimonadales bacterium]